MSIKFKISAGFVVILFILVLVGVFAYFQAEKEEYNMTEFRNHDVSFYSFARKIQINMLNLRRYEKDFFLNIGNRQKQNNYISMFDKEFAAAVTNINEMKKIRNKSHALDDAVKKKIDSLMNLIKAYNDGVKGVFNTLLDKKDVDPRSANAMIMNFKEKVHSLESHIKDIALYGSEMMDLSVERNITQTGQHKKFNAITLILGAIVSLVVILILLNSILKPIRKLVTYADEVASGNLDAATDYAFTAEMGQLNDSLQNMIGSLKQKIQEADAKGEEAIEAVVKAEEALKKADQEREKALQARKEGLMEAATRLDSVVEGLSGASMELSSLVKQVGNSVQVQDERLSGTAAAMEEMNAAVLEVASKATNAVDLSQEAKSKALSGDTVVQNVVSSTWQVHERSEKVNEVINELGSKAQEIGRVMDVITDIADQTNLLALNAAIEAARAGDAGRGFAVVADEVRKLAEKTMDATKEVHASIESIQSSSARSVEDMNKTTEDIRSNAEMASTAGNAIQEVLDIVDRTNDQVVAIATGSEQQSATSEEINQAVSDLSRISTETSTGMEQAMSAIDGIAELSGKLEELTRQLRQG